MVIELLEQRQVLSAVAFDFITGTGDIVFSAFPQEANEVQMHPGLLTVVKDAEHIPLFHAPPCFHANLLNELEASVGFIVEVEIPLNIFATFPEATYCPSIGGAASFFGAIGSGIVQGGSSVVAGAQIPA